ncbi:MAG: hypothetical protein WAW73_10865 [Rhodoferax sp.]
MDKSDTPIEANLPPPKKRNRRSKLDQIYYPIARVLMENARRKFAEKKPLSLERIANDIEKKHGISFHKSTLSRYIKKHWALKLL